MIKKYSYEKDGKIITVIEVIQHTYQRHTRSFTIAKNNKPYPNEIELKKKIKTYPTMDHNFKSMEDYAKNAINFCPQCRQYTKDVCNKLFGWTL